MRLRRPRWTGRLSLTQQVALLSLVPVVALGFILARVLETQIVTRTVADADQSAQLVARLGIQPELSPRALREGLTPAGIRSLDRQLSQRKVSKDLARIKIWSAQHKVIYSDIHSLIGRTLAPSDDLEKALAGKPKDAQLVTPSAHSETASEVGLGQLVEVYVPLRFAATGPPAGAFEIYLSYRPIAAAVARDKRTIMLLVAIGLGLLWAVLYRIVARASRRLRRQARDNYRLAYYDQLTGLPNRTLFIERVGDAVRREAGGRGAVAVLLLDLDRFTEINNTLGNANGDAVLREVARRLSSDLAGGALAARLGGDEYAVVCPHTDGVAGAQRTAAAIQASLETPIALDGVALNVEASIGIAVMGPDTEDPDLLLQHADAALGHARSQSSRVEVYSEDCNRFDATRLVLLGEVRGALERGEFTLFYQPKMDLQSRRLTGVEALVRWRHPRHGLLSPASFIPLVEQTALIGPLTNYVIDEALRQMTVWRRRGIDLDMAVNLSARNLLDPALPGLIADLLARHGVAARRLTVEITESASMVNPERAVAVLRALRASGVGVSVDDFGTGNASIDYLAALPASEIKIDKSFITEILGDARAEAIVRSTIDLARNLGLGVVAEGIETEAVLEHLSSLGCATGQGYFLSRPLPAEELTSKLTASFGLSAAEAGRARGARAVVPRS
ncbi:MAG: putative diguanylate cyclase/phosphodiesterase [Solirubrobacterales bacterium]|jgi:diguanylate cyclase (GGDEF)-like protein|nr:putative diguanylate cyclase/phosphodiesterase [Solirubrobacterales bacterium]